MINDKTIEPELQMLMNQTGKQPSPIPYINEYKSVMDVAAMQSLGFERFCTRMRKRQKQSDTEYKIAVKKTLRN